MSTKQAESIDLGFETGRLNVSVQIKDSGQGRKQPHWVASKPQNRLIIGFWVGPQDEYSAKAARAELKKLAAELEESSNEYYREVATDIGMMLHSRYMQLKTNNSQVNQYPVYFEADMKEIDMIQKLNKEDLEKAERLANQIFRNSKNPKNSATKRKTGRDKFYRPPERGPIQEDSIIPANQEARKKILEEMASQKSYANSYVPEMPKIPIPPQVQEINPVREEIIPMPVATVEEVEEPVTAVEEVKEPVATVEEVEEPVSTEAVPESPTKKVGKRKKAKEKKKAQRAAMEEAAANAAREIIPEEVASEPISTEEIVERISAASEQEKIKEVIEAVEEEPQVPEVVEPVIVPEVVASVSSTPTPATTTTAPVISLKTDRGDAAYEACFHIGMNLRKIMNADDAKGILELIFGSSNYAEFGALEGFFNKWDPNKKPFENTYYSPYDFSSYKRMTTRIFNKATKEVNSNG